MNDHELNQILKSAQVPERSEEYWKAFPGHVTEEIQAREMRGARRDRQESARKQWTGWAPSFGLKLAFGAGLACLLVAAGFLLGLRNGARGAKPDPQLAEVQKCFREIEGLFPNQLRAIVFDDRGPELVLADGPTVPTSTPLYLKITGPKASRRYITFSGQQIQINGDTCDVLVDRSGNVLVVGRELAWSSSEPAAKAGRYQIEARALGGAS